MTRAPLQVLVIPFRLTAGGPEYGVLRRSDDTARQFVAGGAEEGEAAEAAANREFEEEFGVKARCLIPLDSLATIPASHFRARSLWGDDVFVVLERAFAVDVGDRLPTLSDEHLEVQWLSYEDAVSALTWDSNRNALWELHERLHPKR